MTLEKGMKFKLEGREWEIIDVKMNHDSACMAGSHRVGSSGIEYRTFRNHIIRDLVKEEVK